MRVLEGFCRLVVRLDVEGRVSLKSVPFVYYCVKESYFVISYFSCGLNFWDGIWVKNRDHSPFLGTESSFYRRSKINKYTRRLLKTWRGHLDITLWPYEDYSITQDDSPRMTRWGTITWRELLHETRWLDEDNSTRVTRRGDDSKRMTRRGSHDEARSMNTITICSFYNPVFVLE